MIRYDHLVRMTTATGLYEHARFTAPRIEHGMCVDDVARALVVTVREADPTPEITAMSHTYAKFLLAAQTGDGRMRNRRTPDGEWLDQPSTHDHWGRALWAFGTTIAFSTDPPLRTAAHLGAIRAMRSRSVHPRATAYAAIGAAALFHAHRDGDAEDLLLDARAAFAPVSTDPHWPWPYDRLTYANAVLPEAMIAVGRALGDDTLRDDGLALLAWLEDEQTVAGHLSVVPAGGRGPGDPRPGFDQQPIEVTALAEAARTAHDATGDPRWTALIERCVAWFEGDNDRELRMYDPVSGGGFDGLEDGSVNRNQGAESTIAWLTTCQLAPVAQADHPREASSQAHERARGVTS